MRFHFYFLLALLLGCQSDITRYATIHVPVIKECQEELLDHLDNDMWRDDLEWTFNAYSDETSYWQYPNLVGSLELHSTNKSIDSFHLQTIVNGPILGCYPTSSTEVAIDRIGLELRERLDFLERTSNSSHKYLVLSGDKVTIYFSEKIGAYNK